MLLVEGIRTKYWQDTSVFVTALNLVLISSVWCLDAKNTRSPNFRTRAPAKMATPISIYGQKIISEMVSVRRLNVCLKEAEWPCLYSTCEATYGQISFVFELFTKNCSFFCALRKMLSRKRQKR